MKVWKDVTCQQCRGSGLCWFCSGSARNCRKCHQGRCTPCEGRGTVRIWYDYNPLTGKTK